MVSIYRQQFLALYGGVKRKHGKTKNNKNVLVTDSKHNYIRNELQQQYMVIEGESWGVGH